MKIIVIPHTHWDREWYFTNEVSDSFLKYNLDNFLEWNQEYDYFYLDGQVSLIDDYLEHATKENKDKLFDLIKKGKVITGPLYSQPDVFNSLGETTLRNIDFAADILEKHNLPNNEIFYCPDTFGFGNNFPQILNFKGFDKFVFWRGLSYRHGDSDYNTWIGNNSKLTTYRYKLGYSKSSYVFPWRELNESNIDELAKIFHDQFVNHQEYNHYKKQAEVANGKVMFPIGGDQIPFHPLLQKFFQAINKLSHDEWVIGRFEDYFEGLPEPKRTFEGTIEYSSISKIHRTISTSRYDFKKLYRENEIKLYHQLEPLEMYYKINDDKYNINNDLIFKFLLCMQAHDVLGGCITDNTNLASKQKLININEIIETKKAIVMKQLATNLKLTQENLLVFNPNFDKNSNNLLFKTVYTNNKLSGKYVDETYEVHVLNSSVYDPVDNCYKSDLIFINKNIKPFSVLKVDFNKLQPSTIEKGKYDDYHSLLNFEILKDSGDLFDADWVDEPILEHKIEVETSTITKFENFNIIEVSGDIFLGEKKSPFELNQVTIGKDHYYHLEITNQFENVTVSWKPPVCMKAKPQYLQHLGIDEYEHDKMENWKEVNDADYPIDVKRQTGLIFNDQNYICSSGTNAFTWTENDFKIYLYRPCGVLGKADLKSRPGVSSGLVAHRIATPQGMLLNEKLVFDFKYGQHENKNAEKLNSFYRKPMLFHNFSVSKIESFIEKFIFLEKPVKISDPMIESPKGFISSSYMKAGKVNFTYVDFDKNSSEYNKLKQKIIKL